MGSIGVSDITITPLNRIKVAGGDVLHCMKVSDAGFINFGEAYFSWISYESIKAWKRHLKMTLNLCIPHGRARFIFIDNAGAVRQEEIGDLNYVRLTVHPGSWFGFKGLSKEGSLLLNLADIVHDPLEVERREIHEMLVDWEGVR